MSMSSLMSHSNINALQALDTVSNVEKPLSVRLLQSVASLIDDEVGNNGTISTTKHYRI